MEENSRKVIIDLDKEVTQKKYAELKGLAMSTVNSWVKRNKIEFRVIPELNNLVLIPIDAEPTTTPKK